MELSFLYIQKYARVEDVGLNFLSDFKIYFDKENRLISIHKQRDHSEQFYKRYDANITAVSSIVGQNGVGKSTILRFIRANFIESAGGVHAPCVVGIYDRANDQHYVYTHKIEEPGLAEDSIQPIFRIIENKRTALEGMEVFQSINAFEDITVINYSGLLDLSPDEQEYQGSYNISTNRLAYTATQSYTGEDLRFNYNEIDIFRTQEVERQIRFYEHFKETIPFELPDFIVIRLKFFNRTKLRRDLNDNWIQLQNQLEELSRKDKTAEVLQEIEAKNKGKENILKLVELLNAFEKELRDDDLPKLKYTIYELLFYSFAQNDYQFYRNYSAIEVVLNRYFNKIKEDRPKTAGERIRLFFELNNEYVNQEMKQEYSPVYVDYDKILPLLEQLGDKVGEYHSWDNRVYLELNDKSNLDLLFKIFNAHTNALNTGFLDFFWTLSSGQQTLFSLYSRFYDIIHRTKTWTNLEIKNNILILLDEAEISLHPEWQRTFLDDFLTVISEIFKEKNIQIIFTTHSPFVLSDLLLSQINFLKYDVKSEKGILVKNPLEEQKSTFGASISTLLQDSFFMKDGFSGSLVISEMDKFMDFIINKDVSELKKAYDYIDWFVQQIGEPIVKNKLIQIIESRLAVDLLNTSSRLDDIENRLKNIEEGGEDGQD